MAKFRESPSKKLDNLPSNIDYERFVLGSIILNGAMFDQASGIIEEGDLVLEKHRRIFKRMRDLRDREDPIDRVTVANELLRYSELEICDGLSYLVSLDDGLPQLPNIESYCRGIKDASLRRSIIFAGQHLINRAAGEEAVSEVLASAEQTIVSLQSEDHLKDTCYNPARVIREYKDGLNKFITPVHELGICSGFKRLDQYTYGYQNGKTYIVAGRSSHGKSTFMGNAAGNIAENGIPVLYLSLEMRKEDLLRRMISRRARVSHRDMMNNRVSREERHRLLLAANDILNWPIYFDDSNGLTIMDVKRKIRKAIKEHNVKKVFVDYLQRLSWARDKTFSFGGSAYSAMSTYSTLFKDFAGDFNIPISIGCQMSRKDKKDRNGKPELRDLRDSGRIEEDADVVLAPYYEWRDDMNSTEKKNKVELYILKQRNGSIGMVPMIFEYRYISLKEDEEMPEEGDE